MTSESIGQQYITQTLRNSSNSIIAVGAISAPLGMFLDNYHGLFNTLTYEAFQFNLHFNDNVVFLKSAAWV